MNAFDKNFVGQIPTPTRKERGYASAARKMSQHMQAQLDRSGPAKSITRDQKSQAAAKTAKLKKASI